MKKIAIVNVFFPPQSIGGATRVLSDNIDGLVENYSDQFQLVGFTSEAECTDPYEIERYSYKGFPVYRCSILWRPNMDWHAKDKRMYKIFSDFLDFEQPDLVHFHCVQRLTASVVEATRDAGIPYLVTAHDAWWISDYQFLMSPSGEIFPEGHDDPFENKELPEGISVGDSFARSIYLKEIINDAEKTISVSRSFERIYNINGIVNTDTIPNGISSSIEWLPKDTTYTDRVVCGHIGGMSDHKGYDIFKSTLETRNGKLVEGLVVDHSKESDHEHVEYWNDVKVTFVGRQKQNDIVVLYGKIDVLFAPSKWPESFGLVTREAAACGCWVIASNLGGIGEDVKEGLNGMRISPDKSGIEKAFDAIEQNPRKYKALCSGGNIRYSEDQVEKLVKIYGEQ